MASRKLLSAVGLVLGIGCVALAPGAVRAGALAGYVQAPDPEYGWTVVNCRRSAEFQVAHLRLTSQKWHDSVWRHDLQVVVPDRIRNPEVAFLFITGDGDGREMLGMLKAVAERAGVLAAVVTQVPNQPLYEGRREDALIAYTFDQYLKSQDPTWPLLFPMVKSATRALDALTEYAGQERQQKLTRFIVSGASKRGWTTWLTGAVDTRVAGIAPMVIDMLNMKAQVNWADKVYGRQSEQIHDYTDLGLIARMDEPEMLKLRGWVDPFSYRERYTMPKLILLGTNDPYWTVDALRHYWSDLPEPKLIFQVPNGGHGFKARNGAPDRDGPGQVVQSLAAFVQMIADRQPLPRFDWKITEGANPEMQVKAPPATRAIRLWAANSRDRDFRDETWSVLEEITAGTREAQFTLEKPDEGYRAYLVEISLSAPTGEMYRLSTRVRVVPDGVPGRVN